MMKITGQKTLITGWILLIYASTIFLSIAQASCNFSLTKSGLLTYLATAPTTGMGYQLVELEMKNGHLIQNVFIDNGQFLHYSGPRYFQEIDIKRISRIFDYAGRQIYP